MTILEILVSLGIGMALVALGTSAMLHVAKVFTRNTAHLHGHDAAAIIAERLTSTLESLYHPALMRIHADPGVDTAWGTGDEAIELTWMSTMRSLDEGTMTYTARPMHDVIWHRMVWQGDGLGGGALSFSNSHGRRWISGWTYSGRTPSIVIGPFVRRDRRRDLDDNDLRHLPGMNMATYLSVGAPGDDEDLDERLKPWHPPMVRVERCVVEVVDAGGYVVRADPAAGVTIRSPSGVAVAPLGTFFSDATTQILEGTWLDGRAHIPAYIPPPPLVDAYHYRPSLSQRPSLIRIRFDLVMTTDGERVRFENAPRLPFTVSVAPSVALPPL